MGLSQAQLLTLVGVLLILFLVVFWNNVTAARARRQGFQGQPGTGNAGGSSGTSGHAVDPLLVKFARHEGSVVGESVALDGDDVILKQAGEFKAVPRAQCEVVGEEIVVKGAVDWD